MIILPNASAILTSAEFFFGIWGEAELILRIWGAKEKYFHGAEEFSFRDLGDLSFFLSFSIYCQTLLPVLSAGVLCTLWVAG